MNRKSYLAYGARWWGHRFLATSALRQQTPRLSICAVLQVSKRMIRVNVIADKGARITAWVCTSIYSVNWTHTGTNSQREKTRLHVFHTLYIRPQVTFVRAEWVRRTKCDGWCEKTKSITPFPIRIWSQAAPRRGFIDGSQRCVGSGKRKESKINTVII